jgi:hypothetical protein
MCYLNAVDSPPDTRPSLSARECAASLALTDDEPPAGVELAAIDGGDSRPIAEIPSITAGMITATRSRIDALHARSTLVRETTLMEALAELLDLLEGTARRTGVIRIDALLGVMVAPLRRGVDPHAEIRS